MPPVRKKHLDTERLQAKLKSSSAYQIAYRDLDFLNWEELRPIRLQLELQKPELIFRKYKVESTIVAFGSTRILEPKAARAKLKDAEELVRLYPKNQEYRKRLAIAKSLMDKSRYYEEARKFGQMVSEEVQSSGKHEYVIVTGGGPGIMEAANRGAFEVNAKSIGLNITLPMEQEPNAYITPELCMQFHYFAIRKMHFLLRAKALVAFPGGFGTLDELFEALTLVQTKKVKPLPIVLFGEKYWRSVLDFDRLVAEGTIDEEDLKLFVYAERAEDAWNYIKHFFAATNGGSGRGSKKLFRVSQPGTAIRTLASNGERKNSKK
jgi:uncharacterized protein (TIGR00730 family)